MKKRLLALTILFAGLMGSPSNAQTILFTEDFASGALPSGWTNDSLGQPAIHLWYFNNPFARAISGAGFDANFALFDSDDGGVNNNVDELASLTTPSINISGVTPGNFLFLEMDEQFRPLAGPNSAGSARRIEVSNDGGLNWTSIVYDSLAVGYPNPAVHTMYDVTAFVGAPTLIVRLTWTGSWDWWWAVDNFKLVEYPTCNTPPNAGSAVASVPAVCNGVSFTLNLVGEDQAVGLGFQWQSSPDDVNYTDIPGATTETYAATQSDSSYYRCNVTCNAVTSSSVSVFVGRLPANLCYCIAPHGVDCSSGNTAIINVSIATTGLNHNSVCDQLTAQAYTIWPPSPTTTADLMRGSNYDISVTTDGNNIISVWIDQDQSGTFDPSEWVQVCTTSVASSANTISYPVSVSALQGPTVMRVRSRLNGNQNGSGDACLNFGSGETEDYFIGLDYNVGIQTITGNDFIVYPNPVSDFANIIFGSSFGVTGLKIYNYFGSLLQSHDISNEVSKKVSLANYPSGIYLVVVETPAGSLTKKIIK